MSALATIVGGLGELSESELRQLYLMIGVRLGIPDAPTKPLAGGQQAGKSGNAGPSSKKSSKKGTSSKGNPSRKSQWANHPLYQEYSALKKVVESQAKEARTSFNAVDTPERRAYNQAFIHWMEAKSSFRDRRNDGKEDDDEESSEDEGGPAPPAATQAPPAVKPAAPAAPAPSSSAGENSPAPPAKPAGDGSGKSGPPKQIKSAPAPPANGKGKGKAPSK